MRTVKEWAGWWCGEADQEELAGPLQELPGQEGLTTIPEIAHILTKQVICREEHQLCSEPQVSVQPEKQ